MQQGVWFFLKCFLVFGVVRCRVFLGCGKTTFVLAHLRCERSVYVLYIIHVVYVVSSPNSGGSMRVRSSKRADSTNLLLLLLRHCTAERASSHLHYYHPLRLDEQCSACVDDMVCRQPYKTYACTHRTDDRPAIITILRLGVTCVSSRSRYLRPRADEERRRWCLCARFDMFV